MKLQALHRLSLLAFACAVAACAEDDVAADKADLAADAQADGKGDQLDICAGWDWYDDDFCDDPYGWCAQPDPDCGPDGDSCPDGYTWSGRADEGCVEDTTPEPFAFEAPTVIGRRSSTAFEYRAWGGVAVDDAGGVHAVYVNSSRRPTYARPDDDWQPHVLDDGAYVRGGLTIAAESDVHVAFVDDHYRLNHLLVDDAAVADDDQTGPYVYSVGFALDGELSHFVFGSGDRTNRLGARSGTFGEEVSATIVELENITEAPESPSVITRDGQVHAVYGTKPAAYNYRGRSQLRYAVRDAGGTWSDRVVADATRDGGAIAVGPEGDVHAVYRGFVDGAQTLMFASLDGGTWSSAPLFGAGVGGWSPNIVADDEGVLHVMYRASGSVVTYTAQDADGNWSEPVAVDPAASMSSADRVGLALGPDGALHAVYTDTQTLEVRYVVGR